MNQEKICSLEQIYRKDIFDKRSECDWKKHMACKLINDLQDDEISKMFEFEIIDPYKEPHITMYFDETDNEAMQRLRHEVISLRKIESIKIKASIKY